MLLNETERTEAIDLLTHAGADAGDIATARATRASSRGEDWAARRWHRIATVIDATLRTPPPPSDRA